MSRSPSRSRSRDRDRGCHIPYHEPPKGGKAWKFVADPALKKNVSPQASVTLCVEINQCVGCTRQFFTKSFLGDDAAVLAQSSGEEPAPPRYRAGVASMAWRTTR